VYILEPWVLRVFAELAWGYSIRLPGYAKRQSSHTLPPPSTLIGALAYPVAFGTGECFLEGKNLVSSAQKFMSCILAASARYTENSVASLTEDINRYLIAQFQKKERRKEPAYRFGAIPVGKVYAPSQEMEFVYALDGESCSKIFGDKWKEKLISASYSIIRLGSKEGIVSIKHAELQKSKEIKGEKITTPFYFPQDSVNLATIKNEYYVEEFWEVDYTWRNVNAPRLYIVPGTRSPIRSKVVEVVAKRAFEVEKYAIPF
jgi:CRISPR-associated protein Cas5, Apern subtype